MGGQNPAVIFDESGAARPMALQERSLVGHDRNITPTTAVDNVIVVYV
jgi:hypothetical protein